MLIIDRPDQSTDYTVFNLTHTPEVSIAHKTARITLSHDDKSK
jgi:hypothetical protein